MCYLYSICVINDFKWQLEVFKILTMLWGINNTNFSEIKTKTKNKIFTESKSCQYSTGLAFFNAERRWKP